MWDIYFNLHVSVENGKIVGKITYFIFSMSLENVLQKQLLNFTKIKIKRQ